MDFTRGPDGVPREQFQHAATTAPAFSNITSSSSGSGDRVPQRPHQADDPHVRSTFPHKAPRKAPRKSTGNLLLSPAQFDIFEWYPKYESCQRYFVDHAQQSAPVQALAAFVNITLPFARPSNPIAGSEPRVSPGLMGRPNTQPQQSHSTSLVPYIRRLVVTGLDYPGVLHGFFGDDWASGVGPLHEQERRNYLFAAKSGGWASVKKDYDMLPMETVPFMRPLQGPVIAEIEAAEKSWSEWLAMEDWMVGPRAPDTMEGQGGEGGGESSRARRSRHETGSGR